MAEHKQKRCIPSGCQFIFRASHVLGPCFSDSPAPVFASLKFMPSTQAKRQVLRTSEIGTSATWHVMRSLCCCTYTNIYIYVYVSTYRWMPHAKDAYRLSPLELGQCERHCLLGRLRRRDNNNKLLHLPRDRYSGAMGWGAEVFTGVTKLSISLIT